MTTSKQRTVLLYRQACARVALALQQQRHVLASSRLAFVIASSTLLFSCSQQSPDASTVRVVSWGGQFQADLIGSWVQPASKATGISLQTEAWDGDYGALTTRIDKKLNTWDLVHVELFYVLKPQYQDLFETFPDRTLFTLSEGIRSDKTTNHLVEGGYAAPVLEYAYVVAGRSDKSGRYNPATIGWKQFWDLEAIPGRRGLRDFPVGNIEAALASLGHDPRTYLYNESDPAQIQQKVEAALNRLTEISSSVVWWKTGDELQQGLESGDMVLAGAWSGRVLAAFRTLCPRATQVDKCVIAANPSTALISTDWWVIPKASPHAKNANRLLIAMFSQSAITGAIEFSNKQGYAAPVNQENASDAIATYFLKLGSSKNSQLAGHIDEQFWSKNFDAINDTWRTWRARTQRNVN